MSDQPPKNPLFDNAPGGTNDKRLPDSVGTDSEAKRIQQLKELLPKLQEQTKRGGRAEQFYPYLLVRSVVGDRGDRPINVPFWESPDIWTAVGDPSTTPRIPSNPGGTVIAGQPNTVYAHVWNLGRAPIAGVKVEYYWFNPSLGIDGAHANLIGVTRVDLGPRSSPACHALVKCPTPWTPVLENNGHECLVVRVSAIGDPISSAHPWDSWADRHVAQRNVHVAAASKPMDALIRSLNANRFVGTRTQLVQVGEQAQTVLSLAAPRLAVDPSVQTHVLAELRADGTLLLPVTPTGHPAGQPPVHSLAPVARAGDVAPLAVARVNTAGLATAGTATPVATVGAGTTTLVVGRGGDVPSLLLHRDLLSPEITGQIKHLPAPAPAHAQVLRIASYRGDQLVGGYTIILTG